MRKIIRNLASDANKAFWKDAETVASDVRTWPDWKRAGINVSSIRTETKTSESAKETTRPRK
jgi:ribosomal protein L18E